MTVEAGEELEQSEKDVLKRLGGSKALGWLLDLYQPRRQLPARVPAGRGVRRRRAGRRSARRRGHARCGRRRSRAPTSRWSKNTGQPAGNPDLFLYTIMRKESGFNPHDVSYADARGLLQMIPPTSTQVAAIGRRTVLSRPCSTTRT